MSLRDVKIKYSYSKGIDNDIKNDFVIPVLKESCTYLRSVGYFLCSSIIELSEGIDEIIKRNGKIRIVASPNLSVHDIELIKTGYKSKKEVIEEVMFRTIEEETLISSSYENIPKLISNGVIDFKLVVRKNLGLYHDKLGICIDENNNVLAFVGSANETYSAYEHNYEKIRVFKGWESESDKHRVEDELGEFLSIWKGTHTDVDSFSFSDALKKKLIKKIEESCGTGSPGTTEDGNSEDEIVLRDYQEKAISEWKKNNYNGFFEMATGTGKTWTAIFAIKELMDQHDDFLTIIVAPYKHLVEQWKYDLKKVFKNDRIVSVSSDHPKWEETLRTIIKSKKYLQTSSKDIVVTTLSSFALKRFRKLFEGYEDGNLLVVDEAHRFYSQIANDDLKFQYKLGLSATPHFSNNQDKTDKLINYFDKVVFKYTLEQALGKHLVNYYYKPKFIELNFEEEERFKKAQRNIASCFRNGVLIKSSETLGKYIRQRNRVIARADGKEKIRLELIDEIPEKDHLIIYCGDGYVESDTGQEDKRYIDQFTKDISDSGYRVHKFTSTETLRERMELISDFSSKMVDMMVAIKCLDEGVNIPSIKTAILLANNDDSREFIQRRGRILRKYEGKETATIIDVIVLPKTSSAKGVAKIELRRMYEFARLSINKKKNLDKFNDLMRRFNIEYDEVVRESMDASIWEETHE